MTLSNFFDKAIKVLVRASVDRKSDVRNIVVSVFGKEYPCSRIMVLREVDVESKSFIFFSDSKSEKCNLLRINSASSLLAWDRKNRIQIRVIGDFFFVSNVKEYWDRLGDNAKKSYGNYPFSSTPITEAWNFEHKAEISNFTVLKFVAKKFDILRLSEGKHARAIYESKDSWRGTWVVP